MKRSLVLFAAVSVSAVALLASAQSPSPDPRMRVEHFIVPTNTPPGTWKAISDDVKLLVFESERGDYRARLYVNIAGAWRPVAADGLGDIRPFLPAK